MTAFAVINGGIPYGAISFQPARARPTLLLGAADDKFQLPKMRELAERMKKDGWPNELRIRPGGHGLQTEDVTAVVTFFDGVLAAN